MIDLRAETAGLLARMGVDLSDHKGDDLVVSTPITGEELARLVVDPVEAVAGKVGRAVEAFEQWRSAVTGDGVELVVRVGAAGDELARLVGMPAPVDGMRPVGYAVVDPSRTVRYATLDPVYEKNAFEVDVITGAVS